jgi:hypothetical protein
MSEMFIEYMKEEYGKETIVTEYGFCCYILNKNAGELFFSDFYIKPEFRTTIEGKKLFKSLIEIAKNNNCKVVSGIVSVGVKGSDRVAKILRCYLGLGFEILKADGNQILIGYPV